MNEIFAAIFQQLSANVSFNVYDHIPKDVENNKYPYIKLGPIDTNNNDVDEKGGFIANFNVVGFSQYRGIKEINNIADEVYNALQRFDFPDTANYGVSGITESFRRIAVQEDGLTRNSVQQYEIIFEPLLIGE